VSDFSYGGQAVIEGVMIRGRDSIAVAVRRPDGEIVVHRNELPSWTRRWPGRRLPLMRGVAALVESMALGIDALLLSANESLPEGEEKLGRGETALAVAVSVVVAVAVFMVLPTLIVGAARGWLEAPLWLNLLEGLIRIGFLVGYILLISRMEDVRRVLEYHGAEHKVIHAYEEAGELTVEEARSKSALHVRCGTSFLLFVVVVSILLFSFFGWPGIWARIATRLALLPVIAGVSYEIIKLSGRSSWGPLKLLVLPGLWLQRLTTREPSDDQIEVALAALRAVLEAERSRRPQLQLVR